MDGVSKLTPENIYILLSLCYYALHLILNAVPDVDSFLRDATEVRSAVVTLHKMQARLRVG